VAKAGKKSSTTRKPKLVHLEQTVYLKPAPYIEAVMEGIRIAESSRPPRRKPKSDHTIEILKHCFPPDGKPPRTVSDSKIVIDYHAECDRIGVAELYRASHTTLLRCAGRKKS
jgi:hypothetical protein